MMRRVNTVINNAGGSVAALGINVDASAKICSRVMKNESLTYPSVCDEQLFESKLLSKLGLHAVPDNIIVGPDGKVVARSVPIDEIERYLR